MQLYNIHTHVKSAEKLVDYQLFELINIYPNQLEANNMDTNNCYSCGVHPWYADKQLSQLALLEQIVKQKQVLAIGEIGLDKQRGADLRTQMQVFEQQVDIANSVGKPIIIHCVKAWDELIRVYKRRKISVPWIIHGFRGKPEQARQLASLGFYLSIGETFNEAALPIIPLNRLLLETDDATCSILDVYNSVAKTLKVGVDNLSKNVTKNVNCIFQ